MATATATPPTDGDATIAASPSTDTAAAANAPATEAPTPSTSTTTPPPPIVTGGGETKHEKSSSVVTPAAPVPANGSGMVSAATPTDAQRTIATTVETLWQSYGITYQSAQDASHVDREKRDDTWIAGIPLLYGEIALPDLVWLLVTQMAAKPGEVFYDLGSGSGKVVAAAAMTCEFKSAIGIELLDILHSLSCNALSRLPPEQLLTKDIRVMLGDIMRVDWSSADVVYCCSTSYNEALMKQLGERADKMKVGARIATISYQLPSRMFEVTWRGELSMSWGRGTVIVHTKKHNRRLESVILRGFKR